MDIIEKNKKLEIHRVAVAARDIQCAKEGFEAIYKFDSEPADNLYQTLLFGAVISYCRPFMSSEGLGRSSKRWNRFESDIDKKYHEILLNYRNNVVAHSDIDNNKLYIYPTGMILTVGEHSIELDEPMFGVTTPLLNKSDMEFFINLCSTQCSRMYNFLIPEIESRFRGKGLTPAPIRFNHEEI
ncbi:Uncharacterised protein [Zhongshania aliphaticivorans]|uniref:HEPN AbiU2-like domain-containing protein n=1 Tax=Zhongshania aliphaticivorans TaxID=1470434 RepID=A0A5S9NT26_9GAMM|nr:hypothetical protein [Zhongshania aliphaticivorans]CAA0093728.1 Uncharacterised protein [Zhongshania aliphaticivorans]CAA0111740.1 Uncharacterised protein [Zhongshania aliphaticivorans]